MQFRNLGLTVLASLGLSISFASTASAGLLTITGANGKITTVQSDRTRSNGTINSSRTVTYPNGTTSSSTGVRTIDSNGNYTGTVDRTNRQGTTNNYQINGQYTKNNGSVTNTGTLTGANGQQSTYNRTGTCVSGQCTGNSVFTYPNGQTRTTNVTGQRTGQGQFTGTGTVTGRNGKTRSGSFVRTK
jgi:hypothetical protein